MAQELVIRIGQSVGALVQHPAFLRWKADTKPSEGDLIQVNNSFVYRTGIKTNKSDKFLFVSAEEDGSLGAVPLVGPGPGMNLNFKVHSSKAQNRPTPALLTDALEEERVQLGRVVFILVGYVQDDVVLSEPVGHRFLDRVVLDPQAPSLVSLDGGTLRVREVHDVESILEEVKVHFASEEESEFDKLGRALTSALEKLDAASYAHLVLPSGKDAGRLSVLASVADVLKKQRDSYQAAQTRCAGDPDRDAEAFNEVLRISYNFASDATGLIRLVVSICDLKPLIFWGTVAEHHALSEAFRNLPWLWSHRKPSLKTYADTIGDARNSAFHHLFPFSKSLEVPLGDDALGAISLRLFSDYRRRGDNKLSYRDRELVEVFKEFTRAGERRVAPSFWRQNLNVMDRTIALFEATDSMLRLLCE